MRHIVLISFGAGLLLFFQNCSNQMDIISSQKLSSQSQPFVSPKNIIGKGGRSPIGAKYNNGEMYLFSGSITVMSKDGINWMNFSSRFKQSSLQLTQQYMGNYVFAIDGSNQAIRFNQTLGKWHGKFHTYYEPNGAVYSEDSTYTIDSLPGNNNEIFYPYQFFKGQTHYYLTVQRMLTRSENWRDQNVNATVFESYLIRNKIGTMTEYEFVGKIGDIPSYADLLDKNKIKNTILPLYYAASPRCFAFNDLKIACVMRASADDDDSLRKLNPNDIFIQTSTNMNELFQPIFGLLSVDGIYSPPLVPTTYYKGQVPIPPLMFALSNDGGVTWERSLIANQGGVDFDFAYDLTSKRLVLAYGGITYPRRDVAVQYSLDQGQNWSAPVVVTEESDAYTTGNAFLANLGNDKFVLVYDSLPNYIQRDNQAGTELSNEYLTISRILNFNK